MTTASTPNRLANLHAWTGLAVRAYLGWLFLSASWHKIMDPAPFAVDVATYQLLPHVAVNAFAIVVPWVELVIGILLLVGCRVRAASLIVALLMLSFLTALLWALHLGLDMSCGCFASQAAAGDDTISWRTVARDFAWLGLSVYVLVFDRNPLGVERNLLRKKG
jgi:uncharacterized membrane protein YphA (DoxX/SURF4 family)